MTRKKRDILVSGGIALGSLVFLLWVIPSFTPPYPGYGVSSALLPNVAFSIILVLSVLLLVKDILSQVRAKSRNPQKDRSEELGKDDRVYLWHLARFMLPCILLMPTMQQFGFIPGGLLFMLLMQYLCGQRKPLTMVLVAVGSVGVIYAAMRYGLNVPMP